MQRKYIGLKSMPNPPTHHFNNKRVEKLSQNPIWKTLFSVDSLILKHNNF